MKENRFWRKIGTTKDWKVEIGGKEYRLGYATNDEYDIMGYFEKDSVYGEILLEIRIPCYDARTSEEEKMEIPQVVLDKIKKMGLKIGRVKTHYVEEEMEEFEEI